MNRALTYFFKESIYLKNAKAFKNLLFAFVIYRCISWLLHFNVLFGENVISLNFARQVIWYQTPAFFLYQHPSSSLAIVFICISLVLSLFALFSERNFPIINLFIGILVSNIHQVIYTSLTAGDALLVNLLFLSSFLLKNQSKSFKKKPVLFNALHNFSFIALIIQVCFLYAYSAIAKWLDQNWVNGHAIGLVWQIPHYSPGLLAGSSTFLSIFSFILTYLVLIYQTVFPLIFLFPFKIKNKFLWIGIIMHLYIAFVIGLFSFGIIMIITYALFYHRKPAN